MTTENRTAIVVGGAGGIGAAIGARLAADGLRVITADRDLDRARQVSGTLTGRGHTAVQIDILDEANVGAVLDSIEDSDAPAAVLVIASGGPIADPRSHANVLTLSKSDWERSLELNVTGIFLAVKKFAQLRAARPLEHARIAIIGSAVGQMAQGVTDIGYATSKAALLGFNRQAAFDLAKIGITVNVVAPGVVGTPAFMANTTPEMRSGAASGTLVGRLATPEEIATGIGYLVSRDAGYITGTVLDINGGIYMR
jgi:NAD(P)-dependent dehydrogenase (short-subunit alcohol dehydrogenase family)